jgi:hypothetical protein
MVAAFLQLSAVVVLLSTLSSLEGVLAAEQPLVFTMAAAVALEVILMGLWLSHQGKPIHWRWVLVAQAVVPPLPRVVIQPVFPKQRLAAVVVALEALAPALLAALEAVAHTHLALVVQVLLGKVLLAARLVGLVACMALAAVVALGP